MRLGVNIDHTATLREARGTTYPDPVVAALLAEYAGCNSIVAHLREDRRHIKERDIVLIKKTVKVPFNLEMSINRDIVNFALGIVPNQATLVPERRKELTTEGGLDLSKKTLLIERVVSRLKSKGITVSLFIDPIKRQIGLAKRIGAEVIEINTGRFSNAKTALQRKSILSRIKDAVNYAKDKGLVVAAGHGLDYDNIKDILKIKGIEELNIGHSIISRSLFVGIVGAVEEMLDLISKSSQIIQKKR